MSVRMRRNVSLGDWEFGEWTKVWSDHTSFLWPEMSLQSSVSHNTNAKHASCYLWTLDVFEAPHEVYLSTGVFSCACSSSRHSRCKRYGFSFGIGMRSFSLTCFDSHHHHLIIQGIAICIIWWATSCWAYLSSLQIASNKLFTAEYNASAPCFSITVSSFGSSGTHANCHIMW